MAGVHVLIAAADAGSFNGEQQLVWADSRALEFAHFDLARFEHNGGLNAGHSRFLGKKGRMENELAHFAAGRNRPYVDELAVAQDI